MPTIIYIPLSETEMLRGLKAEKAAEEVLENDTDTAYYIEYKCPGCERVYMERKSGDRILEIFETPHHEADCSHEFSSKGYWANAEGKSTTQRRMICYAGQDTRALCTNQ